MTKYIHSSSPRQSYRKLRPTTYSLDRNFTQTADFVRSRFMRAPADSKLAKLALTECPKSVAIR